MISGAKKLIVSAPFGNWLNFPGATSTLGTFTLHNRGGMLYRLWRCLLTLRPRPGLGAWTNRLGLPNPGIASLPVDGDYGDKIISIYGFNRDEWREVAYQAAARKPLAVELNLSCPNVDHAVFLGDAAMAAHVLIQNKILVIAKLPPINPLASAKIMGDCGVGVFHACNTIPTLAGGMSGKPLKQLSLWAVRDIRQWWGSVATVIGGGGITTPDDIREYHRAGADHVAIGSMLLNPFNWRKVPALIEAANSQEESR